MWQETSTKEKYAQLLSMKAQELGRPPTFDEVRADDRLPHPNNYSFYYGDFAKAVDEICGEAKTKSLKTHAYGVINRSIESRGAGAAEKLNIGIGMTTAVKAPGKKSLKDYTRKDWIQWLYRLGGGRLPREETVAEKRPNHYQLMMRNFAGWRDVERRFNDYLKLSEWSGVEVQQENVRKEQTLENARNEVKRRRRGYTIAELQEALKRVQEFVGTTRMPTQEQINRAAHEIGTPCYRTFFLRFGPKANWKKFLIACEESGSGDGGK